MDKRIIYLSDTGIAIIIPAPEAVALYGLHAIAQKDVPAGVPYAVIDASSIPSDRTFRSAWTIDPALLINGVGSESNTFLGG